MKRGNPEAQVQLRILRYYRARGYIIGKIKNKGSQIGKRFIHDHYQFLGLPDLLLFAPKMYFIEVKASVGKQSIPQILFQEHCKAANIPYIIARSIEDIEEVIHPAPKENP